MPLYAPCTLHTLLFGFSVLGSPCSMSTVWDTFQISSVIPALPLLPDWFSHSPGPLPATTATQLSPVSFMVGMRTGLLWLRIELWESFSGSGKITTPSFRENEQLTWKKSQPYGNVAYVCLEAIRCCSWV